MGLKLAKAFGARVALFTTSQSKIADAVRLSALSQSNYLLRDPFFATVSSDILSDIFGDIYGQTVNDPGRG